MYVDLGKPGETTARNGGGAIVLSAGLEDSFEGGYDSISWYNQVMKYWRNKQHCHDSHHLRGLSVMVAR